MPLLHAPSRQTEHRYGKLLNWTNRWRYLAHAPSTHHMPMSEIGKDSAVADCVRNATCPTCTG